MCFQFCYYIPLEKSVAFHLNQPDTNRLTHFIFCYQPVPRNLWRNVTQLKYLLFCWNIQYDGWHLRWLITPGWSFFNQDEIFGDEKWSNIWQIWMYKKQMKNHFLVKIWLSKTYFSNKGVRRIWTNDVQFTRPMA